jgi:hypothetical protein
MDTTTVLSYLTTEEPEASTNSTDSNGIKIFNVDIKNIDLATIKWEPKTALLVTYLTLAVIWIIFSIYFLSRVIGYTLTHILNRFVKTGYLKVGMCLTFYLMSTKA